MKKYYTVKEAAQILGVSTNTIYTYLKEGKITGKRIGRGRFKIPYSELTHYIPGNEMQQEEAKFAPAQSSDFNAPSQAQGVIQRQAVPQPQVQTSLPAQALPIKQLPDSAQDTKKVSVETDQTISEYDNGISANINDLIFMKLFKGLIYVGLGIIYFFAARKIFYFNDPYETNSNLFFYLLSVGLLTLGILKLVKATYPKKFHNFDFPLHLFALLVLAFYSYISLVAGNYGRFVFAATLVLLDASHLVAKVRKENLVFSFFGEFTKYALLLSLIGGTVLLLFPNTMAIPTISVFFASSKALAALAWFGFFTAIPLYLLSSSGANSRVSSLFYAAGSIFTFLIAVYHTIFGMWDLAYLAFMSGIFAIFLAWWKFSDIKIDVEKIHYIVFSFIWIGITVLFGIFTVRTSRNDIRNQAREETKSKAGELTDNLNLSFIQQGAVMKSFVGDEEVKSSLQESDEGIAIEKAKQIFEKISIARRVILFNQDGVAVGVYPRNSLTQGTNFSSREYFQATKETYRGYVSRVFENILGQPSIMQTEPVFADNQFIGMVGVSVDLPDLSYDYTNLMGNQLEVHAVDEDGVFVLSSDPTNIGQKADAFVADLGRPPLNNAEEIIYSDSQVVETRWMLYVVAPVGSYATNFSNTYIFVSLLLVINAIFSIALGIYGASRKMVSEGSKVLNTTFTKPQLTSI